jgi:DNA ligase D-like protein (predicted 3'-phosphoesterase)
MDLKEYKAKRDFKQTSEPGGKPSQEFKQTSEPGGKPSRDFKLTSEPKGKPLGGSSSRFVVQRHQARQLHYDFRLEMEGVLKSWAVPKGVPLEPGIRRLAVQVEDHPLEYIDFAGVIPEGQYGAGTVEIWDRGNFRLDRDEPDHLEFTLMGEKLSGKYILIHTDSKNWLLIKRKAGTG